MRQLEVREIVDSDDLDDLEHTEDLPGDGMEVTEECLLEPLVLFTEGKVICF